MTGKSGGLRRQDSSEEDVDPSTAGIFRAILALFWPTFVARLAWVGMVTTDTALIGHTGTDFLTASSLAGFWMSIWSVLTSDAILGSLCGQAYGAKNYSLVGTWTQVSITIYSWIIIPIFLLFCLTTPALHLGLGTSMNIAGYAGYYAMVMALCLHPKMLRDKVSTFFASQKITKPASQSTPLGLILNLIFGLQLVLGFPFPALRFGFFACPAVTVAVEWFLIFVYVYWYCGKLRYHDKCYPEELQEWSIVRDVFVAPFSRSGSGDISYFAREIRPRLKDYFRLSLPSTLAIGSDFWRMSLIGLLSGTLGNKEVAVFNSSYRIAWLNLTMIGSFAAASSTQLSIALGRGDGELCRKVRNVSISVGGVSLLISTLATVYFIEDLAQVFSSDPEVVELFVEARWEMALMIFMMCYGLLWENLLYALGKSHQVFYAALAGSWLGQVPAVILLLAFAGKTLQNVYLGVGLGYGLLTVLYVCAFLRIDLDDSAAKSNEANRLKEPLVEAQNVLARSPSEEF